MANNYPTLNLKKSLLALIATASLGGLTLEFAQQGQSAFSIWGSFLFVAYLFEYYRYGICFPAIKVGYDNR